MNMLVMEHHLLPGYIYEKLKRDVVKDIDYTRDCTDFILMHRCNSNQIRNSVFYVKAHHLH